jgi:hypothetical protein
LRDDGFFGRHLPDVALIDLRISAVALHIDLGLDRQTSAAASLHDVTAIRLLEIQGFAGFKRREFRFYGGGWINAARYFLPYRQAVGLQPVGGLAVGLQRAFKLLQPTAESWTVIGEGCRRRGRQRDGGGCEGQRRSATEFCHWRSPQWREI